MFQLPNITIADIFDYDAGEYWYVLCVFGSVVKCVVTNEKILQINSESHLIFIICKL